MNVEWLQHEIHSTLDEYGPTGANVWLLSASDIQAYAPPYNWLKVTVLVSSLTRDPETWAETWYYGGLLHSKRIQPPLDLQPIDTDRLISPMDAVGKLPEGFPVADASCILSWPIHPGVPEPGYLFRVEDAATLVGGYTGRMRPVEGATVAYTT